MKPVILFIGRFQPIHKGHLTIIKKLSKKAKLIKIGIGSSQYEHTKDNPFSIKERIAMLKAAFKEANIKNYKLYSISDIHNDSKWAAHVKKIVKDFDYTQSGNSWVLRLFKAKHIPTKRITELQPYSSTRIRAKLKNNRSIAKDVPKSILNYLKKINAHKRIIKTFK